MSSPVVARTLLAAALFGACAPPPAGPFLELPAGVSAVEARFGDAYCRRLEDPETVGGLAGLATRHRAGWQAAWKEPPPPQLALLFESASGATVTLGIGDGQLHATLEGRAYFLALAEAERRELVARAGGPPLGAPEVPCRPRP